MVDTPHALPIFDGHNDVLSRLYAQARARALAGPLDPRAGDDADFITGGPIGHVDLPRARAGGFGGGLFSVYVAADPHAAAPAGPVLGHSADGEPVRLPRPLDLAYAQRVSLGQLGILFQLERAAAGRLRVVHDSASLRACLANGTLAAVVHFEGAEAIDPELDALEVFYRAGLRSLGLVWSRSNDFGTGVPICSGTPPIPAQA